MTVKVTSTAWTVTGHHEVVLLLLLLNVSIIHKFGGFYVQQLQQQQQQQQQNPFKHELPLPLSSFPGSPGKKKKCFMDFVENISIIISFLKSDSHDEN